MPEQNSNNSKGLIDLNRQIDDLLDECRDCIINLEPENVCKMCKKANLVYSVIITKCTSNTRDAISKPKEFTDWHKNVEKIEARNTDSTEIWEFCRLAYEQTHRMAQVIRNNIILTQRDSSPEFFLTIASALQEFRNEFILHSHTNGPYVLWSNMVWEADCLRSKPDNMDAVMGTGEVKLVEDIGFLRFWPEDPRDISCRDPDYEGGPVSYSRNVSSFNDYEDKLFKVWDFETGVNRVYGNPEKVACWHINSDIADALEGYVEDIEELLKNKSLAMFDNDLVANILLCIRPSPGRWHTGKYNWSYIRKLDETIKSLIENANIHPSDTHGGVGDSPYILYSEALELGNGILTRKKLDRAINKGKPIPVRSKRPSKQRRKVHIQDILLLLKSLSSDEKAREEADRKFEVYKTMLQKKMNDRINLD